MKIGLFFGSFNPIHNGHAIIAQSALEQFKLDEIWFVVSPQNPFKNKNKLAKEQERFSIVDLFCKQYGMGKFKAVDFEFYMKKPSYTSDTLKKITSYKFLIYKPRTTYYIIMGSDTIHQIVNWKDYEYIIKNFRILLYERIGGNYKIPSVVFKYPIRKINAPIIEISSTFIRERIKKKKPIDFFVPFILRDMVLKLYS